MRQEYVKVAVTLDDGTVAILLFLTLGRGNILPFGATWEDEEAGYWRREPTDRNLFSEISRAYSVGPQPVKYRRVDESEIPVDRTYREALVDDGKVLGFDLSRAREIHLGRLRNERNAKLDQLDRDWMRAMGQGNGEAVNIEAKRQRLRDAPQRFSCLPINSIDELKALTLDAV